MAKRRHAVLSASGGAPVTRTASVRGGKGAGLALLTSLGLPVPPSFTISTSVHRAWLQHVRIPNRAFGQIFREIEELERVTGRTFGDPDYPLLVSVRSGAEISMPGMMDTILNVGINPCNLSGLTRWGGKRFARDTRARFEEQWRTIQPEVTRDMIPRPHDQLMEAIQTVWRSWDSERAIVYRNHHGIPNDKGTAVTVQAMVFGNIDHNSCTGVVFSADVATGEEGFYGEFLTCAQGEDVVAGVRTPHPISEMEAWNPSVYHQLVAAVETLANHFNDIVDVEFTVQQGELFILQVRRAKRSPLAKVTQAVRKQWGKQWTKEEALLSVLPSEVALLRQPQLDPSEYPIFAQGMAASPGAAVGVVARTSEEAQRLARQGLSPILVREDTSPEDLPGMMVSKAIVTVRGGKTCHAAVVARELGLPAVVGVASSMTQLSTRAHLSVDGTNGLVYRGQLPLKEPVLTKEVNIFLKWCGTSSYMPQIGFKHFTEQFSANEFLTDFYLTDLMARLSTGTPLERDANALRTTTHCHIAEIFALYLLMATSGESRHFKGIASSASATSREAMAELDEVISSARYGSLPDERHRMHADVVGVLQHRPLDFLIKHTGNLVTVFQDSQWSGNGGGGGYGGTAWMKIAQALHNFLNGSLSTTLFVDHVFDLRHNGGKLFNKNPLFRIKTDETQLVRQLNMKKENHSPATLFSLLNGVASPSSEVLRLWGVGKSKGMW